MVETPHPGTSSSSFHVPRSGPGSAFIDLTAIKSRTSEEVDNDDSVIDLRRTESEKLVISAVKSRASVDEAMNESICDDVFFSSVCLEETRAEFFSDK
jgi:hypothetical protein